jgi:uncharacterized membrane protein YdjX (TVP38/TMEM64 family)
MDPGTVKATAPRLALLAMLVAGIAAFFSLGAHETFTFEHLVSHKDALVGWAQTHSVLAPFAFVAAYLSLGLFGLPGSTVLNVTSGLLFGFREGLLLVMLAGTLASSLAFLSFRYLFRGFVEPRVQRRFPDLEEGLKREGLYFVFGLRLVPVIPFSLTNLILAVSPVPFSTYLWVTLLALFPRYLLYVYAGTQLGNVEELDDLYSPSVIGVLTLLAILPWTLKQVIRKLKGRFAKKTTPRGEGPR